MTFDPCSVEVARAASAHAASTTTRAHARRTPAVAPLDPHEAAIRAAIAARRHGDAVERIRRGYGPAMLGLAVRMVKDRFAAEDVVQDALLRIHLGLDAVRAGTSLRAWVMSVTAHRALDELRRRDRCRLRLTGVDALSGLPDSAMPHVGHGRRDAQAGSDRRRRAPGHSDPPSERGGRLPWAPPSRRFLVEPSHRSGGAPHQALPHTLVCNTVVCMNVERLSITMDPRLGAAVRKAAKRARVSLSAWIAEATADRVRNEALGQALDRWEAEDGAFTADELASATATLGLTRKRRARRS
jgi:Sigma-70 region 2